MSANIEISSEENKGAEPKLEAINIKIAQKQLEKLELEVGSLGAGKNWEWHLHRFIPLLTALLSVAGFLFGIHVFNQQQELDRQTRELDRQTRQADRISREESQYRAAYEQLLQFSSNPNMTLAQATFLRQSINSLVDSLYPTKTHEETNRKEKEKWQMAIVEFINRDCDFTQTRQVKFDIVALKKWEEYPAALKIGSNDSVLMKYLQALRDLEVQNPGYLKNIREGYYGEYEQPEDALKEPYRSLMEGFGCHLNLLSDEQRVKAIEAFQKTTNNPVLPAILFPESRALCRQ